MQHLIIPTLGAIHLLHPRYNAVSVLELITSISPSQILLASVGPKEFSDQAWRDDNELSFFHLLPWAEKSNISVLPLDTLEHKKAEEGQFKEALNMFPKGKEILKQWGALEGELAEFLSKPKMAQDFFDADALSPLQLYLSKQAELVEEGPGTGHRKARMQNVAEEIVNRDPAVVLVDLLDYLPLLDALGQSPSKLNFPPSSEAEGNRAILDRAWQLNPKDDWAGLLGQLQQVDGPEAMFCASQIYLAAGQTQDAFDVLEQLVHTEFNEPEYLPGYVLARYGQIAGMLGKSEVEQKAFTAVLALRWAPKEAKEIASAARAKA